MFLVISVFSHSFLASTIRQKYKRILFCFGFWFYLVVVVVVVGGGGGGGGVVASVVVETLEVDLNSSRPVK